MCPGRKDSGCGVLIRTVRAEDSGAKGAPRAQQLPPDGSADRACVFCHERHHIAILVQHCVAIGLLKPQDYRSPACITGCLT